MGRVYYIPTSIPLQSIYVQIYDREFVHKFSYSKYAIVAATAKICASRPSQRRGKATVQWKKMCSAF